MSPVPVLLAALAVLTSGVAVAATGAAQPAHDRVAERLAALTPFVERERGLELRRPVTLRVLGDEDFVAALHEDDETGPAAYDLGATYGALGAADPEEFADEVTAELDDGVVGYYDAVREELVVRERPVDAYLDLVLVHELTHALQDQWFKTDRPELLDLTERLLAFDALVEGDAVRVERAWYRAQPPDVRAELDEAEGRLPGETAYAPALDGGALAAELDFPYQAGLPLVDALLAAGGQDRLDAAFRTPPTTSEHVLHPETLDDGPPLSPPAPDRDGRVVDEGVLGERGLALVLGLDPLAGGPQVGWDGDSYATYDEPDGRLCTVATVAMATPAARDALVEALRDVGAEAEPRAGTLLELASCAS